MCYMKDLDITIDLTKDIEYTWEQIEDAFARLKKARKKTLWQRIKSWF